MMNMDDERLVFFFDDGRGGRRALDPFRVERLLARHLGGRPLSEVIRESQAPVDAVAGPALEKLLDAAGAAFDMPPLAPDGTGFTERARLRVLREWCRFRVEAQKKTGSPPTSPPATAPPPSPSPTNSSTPSG
jgi:hypothetical protein